MSTNLDTLRRQLGSTAAALVLLAGGATQAVAQHSRGDARPSSSSSSSSPAVRPSSGDSSSSSSPSPSSSSHDGASSTRPGSAGSPTRIDRDTRSHRYRGGGYGGGHYYGGQYGYGGYYGFGPRWGWYGFYNSPWYWGYPYGTSVTVYPNGAYGNLGALDLDLAPERAEVYVDGQRVGVADDFDGFPTYLWLEQGTYDVVFYMPGFKTLARQYSIYPGLVIDVEDTLEPGDAVRPEDLPTKTHERRDARLRDDRDREGEYQERRDRPRPVVPRQDWRERNPGTPGAPGAPGAVIEPRRGDDQSRDVRGEPGTLRLKVEPSDASVYLDGRFIGTAEELSDLRSGLIVDPGTHRLEVVRPGWRSETRSFEAIAGDDVEVEIELDEQ